MFSQENVGRIKVIPNCDNTCDKFSSFYNTHTHVGLINRFTLQKGRRFNSYLMYNSSLMGGVSFSVTDKMKTIELKDCGTMWT